MNQIVSKKAPLLLIVFFVLGTLSFAQNMPKDHPQIPQKERQVIVPDFVEGKWDGVIIRIEDRKGKESWEATIPLAKKIKLPGTPFEIEVQYFLPSFFMDDTRITSVSNEPRNPAAKIAVWEDGKKIHDGWIFAMMPEVHAFSHARYGIFLVRGIAAVKKSN